MRGRSEEGVKMKIRREKEEKRRRRRRKGGEVKQV